MYDIVGSLPLELLINVVEHLDPEDIARNQRVSRRWRTIFSCDTITTCALLETFEFLGLEEMDKNVMAADATNYFRWRAGLLNVKPVKKVFLPWPERLPRVPYSIQYHSHQLCYNVWGHNEVEMLNLETGETSTWADPERSLPAHNIRLSDRHLVIVSNGK
ncbi:hypothetical protein VTN49DRAFT_1832 [Thermomyces lanuginosus]|uniref:uncharacterized protein n=1 Tax=Thermomyces lanuginosus TaxID=5541 RepID=UPI003743FE7E